MERVKELKTVMENSTEFYVNHRVRGVEERIDKIERYVVGIDKQMDKMTDMLQKTNALLTLMEKQPKTKKS